MNRKKLYDAWVDRVCDFIGETGPKLDRCASAFQSKPLLDKQADALFFGYNAQDLKNELHTPSMRLSP